MEIIPEDVSLEPESVGEFPCWTLVHLPELLTRVLEIDLPPDSLVGEVVWALAHDALGQDHAMTIKECIKTAEILTGQSVWTFPA